MAKLAHKIGSVLTADVIVFFMSMVTGIILARGLGAEDRGRYALCFSAITIMAAFLTVGLNVASTYFIANNSLPAKKMVGFNALWVLISTILVLVLFPFFISIVGGTVLRGLSNKLLFLVGVMTPVLIANNLVVAITLGLRDYTTRNLINILRQLLRGVFIAIVLFVLTGHLYKVMIANVVSLSIVTVAGCWLVVAKTGISFWLPWPKVKSITKYCCHIYPAALAGLLFGHINVFFVNAFNIPKSELGAYAVASTTMLPLIYFLPKAISNVIFPELSSLSKEQRSQIVPLISRCTLLLVIPMCIVLAILSKPLVFFVFGSEYALTPVLFCLLLPGVIFSTIGRISSQVFNSSGYPHYTSITSITTVLVIVLLDFLLVPLLGTKGAAIAFSMAYGYNTIVALFFCRKADLLKTSEMFSFCAKDIQLLWRSGKGILSRSTFEQKH